jgi:hypothetical protein
VGAARERSPGVPQAPQPVGAVARIVALTPDLLFASRIEATLTAAGHAVELAPSPSEADLGDSDLLIADLGNVNPEALVGLGRPVLGFYSHVDAETRRIAEAAGVDLVVPRSRMAREMPELVARLLARAP